MRRRQHQIRSQVRRHGRGQTVTLRRHNTLRAEGLGNLPTLSVVGATAKGASKITIDGTGLVGIIRHGSTFTVAGDTTVYAAQADTEVASGALTNLPFLPTLSAAAANDTVVTIVQAYGETVYPAIQAQVLEQERLEVDQATRRLVLPRKPDLERPEEGFYAHLATGEVEYIHRVTRVAPGGADDGYILLTGAE